MQNLKAKKSLENPLAQRCVPYLPALKSVCGSLASCILMQQLEYWFRKRPDGFYKFLSPCDHSLYKPGDSWVEELAITAHEFRSAFDKIGCRYKSKKQWRSVIEQKKDPFQNRFYCSYSDVRSGLTYYLRHSNRVNQLLQVVFSKNRVNSTSDYRQASDFSRDTESEFPEIQMLHSQEFKKCISGNKKTVSPIKETEMNNRDNTKKTTASFIKNKTPDQSIEKAVCVVAVNNVIGDALNPSQIEHVKIIAEGLLSHFQKVNLETLIQGIQHSLCDREAYTRAGSDFFKKLNTIQKAIRVGTWSIPAAINEKKIVARQSQRVQLQQQWRELQGEYDHLCTMVKTMQKKGNKCVEQTLQRQVDYCCDRLRQVEVALQAMEIDT